ncbi:helix-turn-helix domain-containing protein [Cohnella hongkongensis]|uniref:Helix-turn-helix domain-containing protein n=1 Tax=Cohnella hongkongensis TaxID=178337 RepID=A0ABV9F780_9BACL
MALSTRVDYKTISPYVRFVHEIVIPAGALNSERFIYDHEFIYVVKGTGTLRIEDRIHRMEPGDLLYIRPRRTNEMQVSANEPMHCFAVHFDYVFLGEAAEFSPYAVYLGRKSEETPDSSWLHARPDAELVDMDIPERIKPARVHDFFDAFRELCRHFEETRSDAQIWLKASMLKLIGLIHGELTTEDGIRISHSHADLMLDAIQYMKESYAKPIDLKKLAARANLSPKYFGTLFKQAAGVSVSQYLTGIRIGEAKRLLRENRHTIEEIAEKVGIGDLYYFSKLFKKAEGLSPKRYADSLRWLASKSE